MKTTSHHYILGILFIFLMSCNNQPAALPTEVPVQTPVSPPLVPTSTFIPVTPSPLPTQPITLVITPDPTQVKRWKEYETALAKAIFPSSFVPGEFLCEWEILGQSDQEVYVWTVCMSIFSIEGVGVPYGGSVPAVIHIGTDGAVQSVKIPGGGTDYASDIRKMFPLDVQERIFNNLINYRQLSEHVEWRREHSEEPPLVVFSATPTP